MKSGKLNICFIKQSAANPKFILNDIEILKKYFKVSILNIKTTNKLLLPYSLLKQFIYLLFTLYKFDLYFIWFADYHSFLPVFISKLFKRKCLICAGGYEATYIEEVNCGVYTTETLIKRIRKFAVEYSLKNCSIILPVDESLVKNVNDFLTSNTYNPPLQDGIKNMIPGIVTRIETVYLGYDEKLFYKKDSIKKERIILSAGLITNDFEVKRKGFDVLIEAAKAMKEVNFVLIGLYPEHIKKFSDLRLSNLHLLGVIPYSELIEHYSRAKVFAQISLFEGLPSTICEAMLCECIPVGSKVNAIPKIINGTGFIIEKRNMNEIIEKLTAAVNSPDELGIIAREQIINTFPFKLREQKLIQIINSL